MDHVDGMPVNVNLHDGLSHQLESGREYLTSAISIQDEVHQDKCNICLWCDGMHVSTTQKCKGTIAQLGGTLSDKWSEMPASLSSLGLNEDFPFVHEIHGSLLKLSDQTFKLVLLVGAYISCLKNKRPCLSIRQWDPGIFRYLAVGLARSL
jgi:hypothetical protein